MSTDLLRMPFDSSCARAAPRQTSPRFAAVVWSALPVRPSMCSSTFFPLCIMKTVTTSRHAAPPASNARRVTQEGGARRRAPARAAPHLGRHVRDGAQRVGLDARGHDVARQAKVCAWARALRAARAAPHASRPAGGMPCHSWVPFESSEAVSMSALCLLQVPHAAWAWGMGPHPRPWRGSHAATPRSSAA